ncbi:MAG: thioredoxin domain-containing protein [Candidatus Saccharibacteria bacterium]|nr:thioredoxin domain-containing protein [Candidatus Saccharibacteria bacterium]
MKKYKGFSKIGVAIAVVAVVAFIGIATFLVIDGNNKATNFDDYNFYSVIAPDVHNGNIGDHVKNDKDGSFSGEPIYIFEYADFQCPGCASINPRINQAIDELDGKLAVVYRNHLLSYHQNATAAASAAEAAGLQGYWKEYADKLFSSQSEWEYKSGSERTNLFEQYFTEVSKGKGDLEKFRKDISSDNVSKKISFDMGIGKRITIEGTPAFFVEGQFIPWSSSEGGSVTIDGKTITWDKALSGADFVAILKKIAEARFGA